MAEQRLTTSFVVPSLPQEWEMFRVNNSGCDGAPLDLPDIALQPDPEKFAWS